MMSRMGRGLSSHTRLSTATALRAQNGGRPVSIT
jgi:hypothetical protein